MPKRKIGANVLRSKRKKRIPVIPAPMKIMDLSGIAVKCADCGCIFIGMIKGKPVEPPYGVECPMCGSGVRTGD